MDVAEQDFEEPPRAPQQLVLDLDGFEGPLDLLLTLAREQKVDIRRLSMLQLARNCAFLIQPHKARVSHHVS